MRGKCLAGLLSVAVAAWLAAGCGNTVQIDSGQEDGMCILSCAGKQCGDDGCGGSCGTCETGFVCQAGHCAPENGVFPDGWDAPDGWSPWGEVGHPLGEAYVLPEIEDPEADTDGDGYKDGVDNCPFDANPSQLNSDDDEGGDACDPNDDNDCDKDEIDCSPKDPFINHQMPEVCDETDNNCNGLVDEDGSEGCIPMYNDSDQDGFGVFETKECLCDSAAGKAVKFGDCNDMNPAISPGAGEVCDDIDNDCDGVTDEGCDEDKDGWCNIYVPAVGFPNSCPFGTGDCYDGSSAVNPSVLEDPGDGVDNNCDGTVDEAIQCPGQCTGATIDAYLCAMEMCLGPSLLGANVSSPTGDDTNGTWAAVNHFGNPGNDLAPFGGNSYALLASGPATGTSHSMDICCGGTNSDPYAKDGFETYDNIEFKVTLVAPVSAIGFAMDYIFLSEEYEEWIGSSFNDKFYILLKAPQTTGNQKSVINFTDCSDPGQYHDFVDPQTGEKQCYIAINTAFSEPCSAVQTNIDGTGFSCGPGDDAHGSSTGWLTTSWPIKGNEQFELTFHIHDSSDGIYDSEVILDNFHFLSTPFTPGTATHK